jgi:hypothetical protein
MYPGSETLPMYNEGLFGLDDLLTLTFQGLYLPQLDTRQVPGPITEKNN